MFIFLFIFSVCDSFFVFILYFMLLNEKKNIKMFGECKIDVI